MEWIVKNDVENLQETDSLNDSDIEINFDCLPEADLLREFFKEFDKIGDEDTSDEEIQLISDKEGVNALKTFINYFDLRIFRKYLRIIRVKEFNKALLIVF
uniref:Uncharacterized protein n=1 Tax=Rhizophagus irregularis (strain DAOM 181602 / DAOM 197198 / MUCL 43194) TaxID=747089 RepID=U9V1K5_RHIID